LSQLALFGCGFSEYNETSSTGSKSRGNRGVDFMATASCGIKTILAIVFSLSAVCADGREAMTKVPVEVTFTQEDCRLMSVLAEGGRVNMDTMTEIIRQGRTFMIPAGTIIVIETVESAGDRMHIKGSDRTLWIDNESLARLCVWLDE
jgi:hypothetical protein